MALSTADAASVQALSTFALACAMQERGGLSPIYDAFAEEALKTAYTLLAAAAAVPKGMQAKRGA